MINSEVCRQLAAADVDRLLLIDMCCPILSAPRIKPKSAGKCTRA